MSETRNEGKLRARCCFERSHLVYRQYMPTPKIRCCLQLGKYIRLDLAYI